MKAILSVFLLLSVAVNVGFLTGCAEFHDFAYGNPCKYSANTDTVSEQDLINIANSLKIKTTGADSEGLKRKIGSILTSTEDVPNSLTSSELAEAVGFLSKDTDTKKKLEKLNEFVSGLEGKTVISFEPEK